MILTKIRTLEFSVAKRTCKVNPELKLMSVSRPEKSEGFWECNEASEINFSNF